MVNTYRELLKEGIKKLRSEQVDDEVFNAKELLGTALDIDCRTAEFSDKMRETVIPDVNKRFWKLTDRRISGEPLQYIIGKWEFFGLPFKVGKGVLIPRQDTETVVENAIRKLNGRMNLTIIDLCSGSGCIGITLEKKLKCGKVLCIEKSSEAFEYLKANAELNNSEIEAVCGDALNKSIIEKMPCADLIISNPPYLTGEDMKTLQKEVSFEPECALFGGCDGLDFYRDITRLWRDKVKDGGMIAFETGMGQEDEVMEILIQSGFENVRCRADLCGINRCVFGFKPVSVIDK